jgi:hypothetical protein
METHIPTAPYGIESVTDPELYAAGQYILQHSHFDDDNCDTTVVLFETREHGNVGDEVPGDDDITTAWQLQDAIHACFPTVRALVSTCDEWVNIELVRRKE